MKTEVDHLIAGARVFLERSETRQIGSADDIQLCINDALLGIGYALLASLEHSETDG